MWMGVSCNIHHQIIGLHFFENHLNGYIEEQSFKNLIHLKFIHIFNDGREFEHHSIYHMNTIHNFDSIMMSNFVHLEELNMVHLYMIGTIEEPFVQKCTKLKSLNLSNNQIVGPLP